MGGFIGGLLAGAVLVLAAAAWLSLTTPLPQRPEVAATPAAAEPAAEPAEDRGIAAPGRDADLVELAPRQPEAAPGAETLGALDEADRQPADKPQVGGATDAIDRPEGSETAAVQVPGTGAGVTQPQLASPAAPQDRSEPEVNTEAPAQPNVPSTSVTAEVTAPSLPEAAPEQPVVATDPQVSQEGGSVTEAPTTDSAPAPDTATAAPAVPQEEEKPRIAALPQIGGTEEGATPRVGTPVVPLTERDSGTDAPAEDGPRPIEAYAATFENPEDKPLMSIVLIDDAEGLGSEALRDFPYPLTFALDPADPQAAEKMARHRAAGVEVMLIADLPAAASAQDAEVSMAVWLKALPETVGILEGTGTGIQGNRALSDQVTAIVGGSGRGLLTQDNGLNTVQKLAARDGVPSAVVFRDFDGAGQSPTVMRRFLDQAAFRAGQEGAVVMLGRLRPDTISALLLWGLQDRASRVALAPVSAVLTRDPG
ncbi:divergent polysaccharide deacetylase family protein [Ruegeria pomeroyi]|nr:divergent polysaccharide deacetylase family protein [Ruegeria pomeroyi]